MRVLARHPDRQLLVEAFVLGQNAARLHGYRRDPVLQDSLLDHDVRFFESSVADLGAGVGEVPADVVRGALVRFGAAALHRLLDVHDRGQLVVLDLDQVGRVGSLPPGFSQHDSDDLALVGDFFLSDREALGHVLLLGHESRGGRVCAGQLALEVSCGVHADDARSLRRVGDVDALDARVREGTAHEGRIGGSGAGEVVDEVAVAGDQARVFAPVDLGADKLRDRHVSCLRPRRLPSWPERCSWSWRRSAPP